MTTTIESPPTTRAETKERLLEAGMHVFAERGFEKASIREICTRAEANPAAVNYHFGDKKRFYAEVLVVSHQRAVTRQHMPGLADFADAERPAEEALAAWIRWCLELILIEAERSPLGRLMARELAQPTEALHELIQRSLLPMMQGLQEIVADLIGPCGPNTLSRAARSVLGQCLLYRHARPALEYVHRLNPAMELPSTQADLDSLARHIAEFSLAGLSRTRELASSGETP